MTDSPRAALYKATRLDGTDFRTGTIDYAAALDSGEVIRHRAKRVRNQPETYLSVSISPSDCTGFSWPCRLFRVEAVGRVMGNLSASPYQFRLPRRRAMTERKTSPSYLGNPHDSPIWQELADELDRAMSKHPPMNSGHEGYATILEELDELWDVVRANDTSLARGSAARKEALQIAAMGLRYIFDVCREELDHE